MLHQRCLLSVPLRDDGIDFSFIPVSAADQMHGSRSSYHRPQHLFDTSINLAISDSKVNLSAVKNPFNLILH